MIFEEGVERYAIMQEEDVMRAEKILDKEVGGGDIARGVFIALCGTWRRGLLWLQSRRR